MHSLYSPHTVNSLPDFNLLWIVNSLNGLKPLISGYFRRWGGEFRTQLLS